MESTSTKLISEELNIDANLKSVIRIYEGRYDEVFNKSVANEMLDEFNYSLELHSPLEIISEDADNIYFGLNNAGKSQYDYILEQISSELKSFLTKMNFLLNLDNYFHNFKPFLFYLLTKNRRLAINVLKITELYDDKKPISHLEKLLDTFDSFVERVKDIENLKTEVKFILMNDYKIHLKPKKEYLFHTIGLLTKLWDKFNLPISMFKVRKDYNELLETNDYLEQFEGEPQKLTLPIIAIYPFLGKENLKVILGCFLNYMPEYLGDKNIDPPRLNIKFDELIYYASGDADYKKVIHSNPSAYSDVHLFTNDLTLYNGNTPLSKNNVSFD